jgi:hypothetical protein
LVFQVTTSGCRLGAERFMGSSEELQECVVRGGAKLLVDASLDVR